MSGPAGPGRARTPARVSVDGSSLGATPSLIGSIQEARLVSYDRAISSTFDFWFTPSHEAASRARQETRRCLDAIAVPSPLAADVELIIAELLANAVEQEPTMPIRLDVAIADGAIQVTVANRSTDDAAFDLRRSAGGSAADGLAERGRGLQIVDALADGVWVHSGNGWTSISCLKRLDQSAG